MGSRRSVWRRVRYRTRFVRPGSRARLREAESWARKAAAALPDHTHAARLVGLVGPPPAGLPGYAGTAVVHALEETGATCLQRCLVVQAWLAAHGRPRDVVIGFMTEGGFQAHAWIPGVYATEEADGFREIARVPPAGSGQTTLRAAQA